MRPRNLTREYRSDPLLTVGMVAMVVALGFAVVVALAASLDGPMQVAAAKPEQREPTTGPLVRSDPGVQPWVERDIPPPKPRVVPARDVPVRDVPARVVSAPAADPRPPSDPKPGRRPAPPEARPEQAINTLLREDGYPLPTEDQVRAAHQPRSYHLPPGAIMSLSVPAIGLRNVPVLSSDARSALDKGVVHLPDTSLPWSDTPERNVYLAGHRLGWPSTGSHLVFYRLDELEGGERITLRGPGGEGYHYRVIDAFTVRPKDTWVTGRVRDRDLLTLQTCTPIPTFEKRLIVRAERV